MPDERDEIAELMLKKGAVKVQTGTGSPLLWDDEAAFGCIELREALCEALAALIREHYAAADAILGGKWAEQTARLVPLPYQPEKTPERPVFVAPLIGEAVAALGQLLPIRKNGGSPAAAVLYQNGSEEARVRMDKADVRCHWLTDLEAVAAAALQSGRIGFEAYCLLLPQ